MESGRRQAAPGGALLPPSLPPPREELPATGVDLSLPPCGKPPGASAPALRPQPGCPPLSLPGALALPRLPLFSVFPCRTVFCPAARSRGNRPRLRPAPVLAWPPDFPLPRSSSSLFGSSLSACLSPSASERSRVTCVCLSASLRLRSAHGLFLLPPSVSASTSALLGPPLAAPPTLSAPVSVPVSVPISPHLSPRWCLPRAPSPVASRSLSFGVFVILALSRGPASSRRGRNRWQTEPGGGGGGSPPAPEPTCRLMGASPGLSPGLSLPC